MELVKRLVQDEIASDLAPVDQQLGAAADPRAHGLHQDLAWAWSLQLHVPDLHPPGCDVDKGPRLHATNYPQMITTSEHKATATPGQEAQAT